MLARFAPTMFVCLWATGFVGARLGMPYAEPGTFLSIRFAVAFGLLLAIILLARTSWPPGKLAIHSILIGMLIHGLYLGSVFWAVRQGMPAGIAAVSVGLQPLLTALLAGWWLNEEVNMRHWAGLFIGIAGVVLVLWPDLDVADSGVNAATVTACILGMVSVTLGTVYQKAYGGDIDLRAGTALQYLGAFVPMFLFACFFETGTMIWNWELIIALVWSIVVLSLFAIFLLMWLIREGSVAQVSSLFFMVPAVAALLGWIMFDESLSMLQILGMVLCGAAVAMAARRSSKVLAD